MFYNQGQCEAASKELSLYRLRKPLADELQKRFLLFDTDITTTEALCNPKRGPGPGHGVENQVPWCGRTANDPLEARIGESFA